MENDYQYHNQIVGDSGKSVVTNEEGEVLVFDDKTLEQIDAKPGDTITDTQQAIAQGIQSS